MDVDGNKPLVCMAAGIVELRMLEQQFERPALDCEYRSCDQIRNGFADLCGSRLAQPEMPLGGALADG